MDGWISEPELMTPREASRWLRVAEKTLANWRSAGLGPPYVRLGHGRKPPIRYRRSDLQAWVDECADRM